MKYIWKLHVQNYIFFSLPKRQWVNSVKLGETKMCGLGIIAWVNTLGSRQNGRHFPDDMFKCIFLNENVWITIKVSLTFVPKGPINNIPALIQIMAWRRSGHKPLPEPMMVSLPTHICITRPQWVNSLSLISYQAITWTNDSSSVGLLGKTFVKFESQQYYSIQEDAFENVACQSFCDRCTGQ